MFLKNPTQHTKIFFIKDPITKDVIRIPSNSGGAKNIPELSNMIIQQVAEWDRITNNTYSQQARKEAADLKLTWTAYWAKVVEHQICLRAHDQKKVCWNDGFGDTLHRAASMVDDLIDKSPRILKTIGQGIAKMATKVATGKSNKKLSGCSSCGGTKVFDPEKKRNLGRVGKLNSLGN